MYSLESLQQKTLKELKEIGWQLNVLPVGDRRCRQNWIDALVGVRPPLLELLEVSPVAEVEPIVNSSPTINGTASETSPTAEVEPVQEPIEVQRQEPIETPPGVESKFGRIVYPRIVKPIEPTAINGTIPDVESRPESADFHNSCTPTAEPNGDSSSNEAASLGSQASDRVLAVAGNSERDKGRALLHCPNQLTATIFNDEQPPNRGEGKGRLESEPKVSQSAIGFCDSPVTFSPRFLATYSPYFGEVRYKADTDGQLNLLELVETDEPPDPDDFTSIDAFNEALARWDAEYPETLTASMDSMCEWAPCPEEWYEPEAENLPLKASSMRELSPPAIESSSTCNFSIPTFDAWCDRANRQNDTDEPPDTGIFARLPGPKPPKFPPQAIEQSHDSDINSTPKQVYCITYCIAAGSTQPARSPPGGDVM